MQLNYRKRIIPVLLLHQGGLVKSKMFKNYTYVGDPINAVRIFNDKEVDEIIILDIDASKNHQAPNYSMISDLTGEAFMPLAYGGGISTLKQSEKLFYSGVEKVILNTVLQSNNGFILLSDISKRYGSQSVIASIDVKDSLFCKKKLYSHHNRKSITISILDYAKKCENAGAGEIFLNSVSRDGLYKGYDLELLHQVSDAVSIPVIICGGARTKQDFVEAENKGASAMAAGSMFVFKRPHNAVLISYDV
jgi:cyclase